MRLGAVRRRKQKHTLARVLLSAKLHDFAPTGQCRNREAVAQCLAKSGEVRLHVVDVLPATQSPAESRDGLVEDEQGTVTMCERPKPVQKSVTGSSVRPGSITTQATSSACSPKIFSAPAKSL